LNNFYLRLSDDSCDGSGTCGCDNFGTIDDGLIGCDYDFDAGNCDDGPGAGDWDDGPGTGGCGDCTDCSACGGCDTIFEVASCRSKRTWAFKVAISHSFSSSICIRLKK